jgi:hypothetical protein
MTRLRMVGTRCGISGTLFKRELGVEPRYYSRADDVGSDGGNGSVDAIRHSRCVVKVPCALHSPGHTVA